MKVITLLNEKGGVGKTTLATHIASGLAIRGKRVMLIDADAQAHSTHLMRLPQKTAGLFSLLVDDTDFVDVLYRPESKCWTQPGREKGELMVLPGNIKTRLIPSAIDDVQLLRERLEELEDRIDVVVIDTSPTPSLLHSMIYIATDYMLYPTECEALSLDGLAKSTARMAKLNKTRAIFGLGETMLLGIQPTMYRVNTRAHDMGIEFIVGQFKNKTWPALPQRTIWQDRAWAQQVLFAYAPDDVATVEAWAMIDRVEKGIGG